LTELIFINDGNPNEVEHPETKRKLINWKKRKLEFDTISKVKEFQIYRYDFFPVYQIRKAIEKKLEETFHQEEQRKMHWFHKDLFSQHQQINEEFFIFTNKFLVIIQ
jgi:hypothetical protein